MHRASHTEFRNSADNTIYKLMSADNIICANIYPAIDSNYVVDFRHKAGRHIYDHSIYWGKGRALSF